MPLLRDDDDGGGGDDDDDDDEDMMIFYVCVMDSGSKVLHFPYPVGHSTQYSKQCWPD